MKDSIVASNVRSLIDTYGYKHATIAERAGYTRQQFSDILNGRKLILADDCMRLREAIGCTYNDLFRKPEDQAV